MALIACHECGKQYSSEAPQCIHCGATNRQYVKPTSGFAKVVVWLFVIVVVVLVLFIALGASISSTPEGRERADERFAIEFCEDEYERLSRDPHMTQGALGIAYGACEKLKQDFRNKWGREP